MYFMIGGDSVLVKYNEIGTKLKRYYTLNFMGMPVYHEKDLKTKVKEFNGAVNTKFWGYKVPKEGVHYNYKACILKMEKNKNYTNKKQNVQI